MPDLSSSCVSCILKLGFSGIILGTLIRRVGSILETALEVVSLLADRVNQSCDRVIRDSRYRRTKWKDHPSIEALTTGCKRSFFGCLEP